MPHLCSSRPSECLMQPKAYYPLFADVHGRRCVVIGGGKVAQRKVTALLQYGAAITLISPTLTKPLKHYAQRKLICHVSRRFRPSDLRGAWLVYAATDDETINRSVYRASQRRRIFTNVVDQTPLCSFIAPAIFRRGPLTIAVSTGGASPSLAKKLRSELGTLIGKEYVPMVKLLTNLRGAAKRKLPQYGDRRIFFDRLVHGRVFTLVRQGHYQRARDEALALLNREAALKRT